MVRRMFEPWNYTVKNFTNFRRVFDQEICTYTQENWG